MSAFTEQGLVALGFSIIFGVVRAIERRIQRKRAEAKEQEDEHRRNQLRLDDESRERAYHEAVQQIIDVAAAYRQHVDELERRLTTGKPLAGRNGGSDDPPSGENG